MTNTNTIIPTNIVRVSPFSGKTNSMEMNLSLADMKDYIDGKMLQDAFPYLSADEREFIHTGITPQEWEETFGKED